MVASYFVKASLLLPRVLRLVCGDSADAARAAAPELLTTIHEVESLALPIDSGDLSTEEIHLWNRYRGIRIKLHHSIVLLTIFAETSTLLSCPQRTLQEQRRASLEIISSDSRGILGSVGFWVVPSIVGDGRTLARNIPSCWISLLRTLWPMTIASRLMTVPAREREMALDLLQRLKNDLGFPRDPHVPLKPGILPAEIASIAERDSELRTLLVTLTVKS